jgi:hypothetical protein
VALPSYATLAEFLGRIEAASHKPEDDVFIESLLYTCSRQFDDDTQHRFYANTQTRYYDLPRERCLKLDAPLLAVTSLTNGTGTAISASEYTLRPYNGPHYTEIRLLQSSNTFWESATSGDTEGVIVVTGSWGYVDRANVNDPESASIIANSKEAAIQLALATYRKRYGVGTDGAATITGAGVVITPRDKSREYMALVSLYRKHT